MQDWRSQNNFNIQRTAESVLLYKDIAKRFMGYLSINQILGKPISIIISGGMTPIYLNREIVNLHREYRNIDWNYIHFFLVDERWSARMSKDSNYRMSQETLISPLKMPNENLHGPQYSEGNIELAATQYDAHIREHLLRYDISGFDLALLGLGVDGHTASLFPYSEINCRDFYTIVSSEGPEGMKRISMAPAIINKSKEIWFIVTGEEKKQALTNVLYGEFDPIKYPAQKIVSSKGRVTYFTDIHIDRGEMY